MFCGKCSNDLEDCVCPDLAERMRKASGAGMNVASRWCSKCDQHYAACECDEPTWMLRSDGKLYDLPDDRVPAPQEET